MFSFAKAGSLIPSTSSRLCACRADLQCPCSLTQLVEVGSPKAGRGVISGWKTKEQGYLLSTHHVPGSFVLSFHLLFHFYQEVSLTNPTLQVRKLRLGESL